MWSGQGVDGVVASHDGVCLSSVSQASSQAASGPLSRAQGLEPEPGLGTPLHMVQRRYSAMVVPWYSERTHTRTHACTLAPGCWLLAGCWMLAAK